MPLKLVKPRKGKSPNWTIRGTYLGRGVNRSAGTGKRAIAVKVLKGIERQIESGRFSEKGEATFASAAASYMKAGGERTYLKRLLEHFGETPLSQIDQAAIDHAAAALYPLGSGATRNRSVYTPISAVLRRGGVRLDLKRPIGSGGAKQTAWLWPEQAEAIFTEAEKLDKEFAALLITLCYTGMRLSEALGLTWNDVRLQDGFAYLPDSKNGEPSPSATRRATTNRRFWTTSKRPASRTPIWRGLQRDWASTKPCANRRPLTDSIRTDRAAGSLRTQEAHNV